MDFEKKPGSRDGKPKKGTRRKPSAYSREKNDTISVVPAGRSSIDWYDRGKLAPNERGMVPGVEYSVNKGKRWEIVEELEKDGDALVVKHSHGDRSSLRDKQEAALKAEQAAVRNAKEPKEEEQPEVIQTRKGPKVKRNVKKKDKAKQEEREAPREMYVVEHNPSQKEAKGDKVLTRDGCSYGRGCTCSYCVGDIVARTNKKKELMDSAMK